MNLWCMPGWPGVSCVDQDGLRLTEAGQPLTSECWDQKRVPSCLESLAFYFYTTTCKASKGIWPEDLCSGSTVFNNCDIIHNTDCRFLCSSCLCSSTLVCQRLLYFFLAFICARSCVWERVQCFLFGGHGKTGRWGCGGVFGSLHFLLVQPTSHQFSLLIPTEH